MINKILQGLNFGRGKSLFVWDRNIFGRRGKNKRPSKLYCMALGSQIGGTSSCVTSSMNALRVEELKRKFTCCKSKK